MIQKWMKKSLALAVSASMVMGAVPVSAAELMTEKTVQEETEILAAPKSEQASVETEVEDESENHAKSEEKQSESSVMQETEILEHHALSNAEKNDLIVHFDMDELKDGKVLNKADNREFSVAGSNAALTESVGNHGAALCFDGRSNYIDLGTDYQVDSSYTIAAWVNIAGDANGLSRITCRSRTTVPGEKDLSLYIRNNGKLEHQGSEWLASDENAVGFGTWQHVAVVSDGTAMKLYVNGTAVKEDNTASGDMSNTDVALLIGAGWNKDATAPFADHMFKGAMDELRIYDIAINDADMKELADEGSPDEEVELPESLFQFTMDEVVDGTGENAGKKVVINETDQKEYAINGTYRVDDFGIYGKSLEFNGKDTYINIGNPEIHDEYTFEAWVNIDPSGGNSLNKIFGRDRTTIPQDAFYFCVRNNGNIEFENKGSSGGTWIAAGEENRLAFDNWSHLAVTCDKSTYKMYLNGELIASEAVNVQIDQALNPNDLLIGSGWNADGTAIFNGHAFKGRMDDVRIFNVALSEEQIKKSTEGILQNLPPEIKGVSPSDGSTIGKQGKIAVTYNMAVVLSTDAIVLKDETTGEEVPASFEVVDKDAKIEGAETLEITAADPLVSGHVYSLAIPAGALENLQGITNREAKTFTFNVGIELEGNSSESNLGDWLNGEVNIPSTIEKQDDTVTISNGIVERTFDVSRNFMTTGYNNLYTGLDLLEKGSLGADMEIVLNDHYTDGDDGEVRYQIGGEESDFAYLGYTTDENTEEIFHWEYDPRMSDPTMKDMPWPAKGKALIVNYEAKDTVEERYRGVKLQVRYEIYDGIPVISKYVKVINDGGEKIVVQHLRSEILPVQIPKRDALYMETSYNGGNPNHDRNNGRLQSVQWTDKGSFGQLISQYSYEPDFGQKTEEFGPAYTLQPGETFTGFRTYELFQSSSYYEWQQLAVKKMYRVLFPQTTDNPTIYHLISSDEKKIKEGIDQAKASGFNMVLLSFGSGVNVEDVSAGNIEKYKRICDYAHEKDILIGSYTMVVARGDQGAHESYNGCWGNMRCMTSATAETSLKNALKFYKETGMDCIEIDGTYPSWVCNNKKPEHIGHDGEQDSIAKQWEKSVRDFYKDLRELNVYINSPDWHYMNGASMGVMGYEEAAFAIPREHQLIYGREIAYYGTFGKMPSMGWTLVPFSAYTGGDDSVFWPYDERINDYDYIIALNMMFGVGGSYRGANGLYQGAPSENVMKTWGAFYNKYDDILNGDVIHIKPPVYDIPEGSGSRTSGQTIDIDGFIHASTDTKQKGLGAFFNQTGEKVTQKVKVPLYFTGLTDLKAAPAPIEGSHYRDDMRVYPGLGDWYDPPIPEINTPEGIPTDRKAVLCFGDLEPQEYTIDSNGNIEIELTMEPGTYVWFTVYDPKDAPGTSPAIPVPQNAEASKEGSQITLNWDPVSIEGRNVKEYAVYRNSDYLGKAFTNTYLDKTAEADQSYEYEIIPVHNTVSGTGTKVVISTEQDKEAPELTGAKAMDKESVQLSFNEKLDRETAENAGSYQVSANTVLSASLGNDGKSVTLKLKKELMAFTETEVEVSDICDLAGNVIAKGSVKTIVFGNLRAFDFNETDGDEILDRINGENGTIYGSMKREPGIQGSALAFDGAQNYVNLGKVVNSHTDYGIAFWFNPEDIQKEQTLLGQQRDTFPAWMWNLGIRDGSIFFQANDGKGGSEQEIKVELLTAPGLIKEGEWNHISLVRNGDRFTLYVNGKEEASEVKAGIDQSQNEYTMWLGGFRNAAGGEPTKQFKGLVDELNFYNTSLTDENVKNICLEHVDVEAKSELEGTVTFAKTLSQADYTPKSYAKVAQILEIAEKLLERIMPSAAELELVQGQLKEAIMGLEKKGTIDPEQTFDELTAQIQKLNQKDYTENAWKQFQEKYQAILAAGRKDTEAVAQLQKALDQLKLSSENELLMERAILESVISCSKLLKADAYTGASWQKYQQALADAQKIYADKNISVGAIQAAVQSLKTAMAQLEKAAPVTNPVPLPKPGTTFSYNGLKYKVRKATEKEKTVSVIGAVSKSVQKITIPSDVKYKDLTFKVDYIRSSSFRNFKKLESVSIGRNVTAIGPRAFQNCKMLSSVKIGKGITSIGNYAFYGTEKKLKYVKIYSEKLSKVGKKAFYQSSSKGVMKVPSSKLSAYKKLLKDKGIKTVVKF